MVNPAILGDEYLYSLNARKVSPWDPPVAGDFSNYLFNLVYSSTNLCGDGFYTCGKLLNLGFFLGFVAILFFVALRFMGYWPAMGFMVAAGLSPLSVYTSMFLPESMYFFFIGLVLLSVLRAINDFSWQNWAIVGLAVGVASLVKPHAWLSAIAIGITLLVVGLGGRDRSLFETAKSVGSIIAGAIAGRIVLGFLVAGPKALGFFGQYLGSGTIEEIVGGPQSPESAVESAATSPIDGVFAIFATQLNTHLLSISALMAISIIGIIVGLVELIRTRELNPVTGFALVSFIWLVVMVIEIVIFTGWITGGGDDHTTRVLLRYYDFLFLVVPLSGLAVFNSKFASDTNVFVRWGLALIFGALITPAFSGFFGTLTIQIADAPNLAGLVVNQDVFNAAAMVGFASIILFATFPKYTAWIYIAVLPVTLIGTGWQIQDQYQGFRGTLSIGDLAGQYLHSEFSEEELNEIGMVVASRFDATNAGLWMDVPDIHYDAYVPGSTYDISWLPEGRDKLLVLGDFQVAGNAELLYQGEGFSVYQALD